MKTVILAAGEGSRLRPLTTDRAKGMVRVVNKPLLQWIIELVRGHGLTDITVDIGYHGNSIREHFQQGEALGVRISYSQTWPLLGTAGNVRAITEPPERTLIIYGDNLIDTDLTELLAFHRHHSADVTIAAVPTSRPTEVGLLEVEEANGRVVNFREKPSPETLLCIPPPYRASAAIYVVEPDVINDLPAGQVMDWGQHVFPNMTMKGRRIFAYFHTEYYLDVGNFERLRQAQTDILAGKVKAMIDGERIADRVWVGTGSEIHPTARLIAPVVIGERCVVEKGVVLQGTVVGNDCTIGTEAVVTESSLWERVRVMSKARVNRAVIADGCRIGVNVQVREGAVLGTNCVVRDGREVPPNEHLSVGTIW